MPPFNAAFYLVNRENAQWSVFFHNAAFDRNNRALPVALFGNASGPHCSAMPGKQKSLRKKLAKIYVARFCNKVAHFCSKAAEKWLFTQYYCFCAIFLRGRAIFLHPPHTIYGARAIRFMGQKPPYDLWAKIYPHTIYEAKKRPAPWPVQSSVNFS